MYYPDDLVEEIRQRNDIVDVIGSYLHLKKSGSNMFGLCPFHNEKSGSFSVSQSKQMFHCFGCGVSGNVITFIMKYENYSFPEAVKVLADRAGIKLPELEYTAEARKRDELKTKILEANKEAAKYYYIALRDETGKVGMDYFKNRGLSDEIMQRFGLGFARTGNNTMYNYLKSKGFSDDVLAQSGLFNYDEKRGMMDKFWNRVIFPIMDANHRVIAFGGRVMGQGEPKYLNSQETPIFEKGRNLFGLNLARTSRKKNFIICEGYMDVIALHQAGFNQAVASLGTAFTSGHAALMRRYVDEVYLSFDSDEAGIAATLRAIPIFRQAGLRTKIIDMNPYKDPDEFIKNLGAEEYQKRIENAEGSFPFEIRMLERGFDLSDPESKTSFFKEVANKILRFEDELERENYAESICRNYDINIDSLKQLIAKQAVKNEGIKVYERPKSGINSKKAEKDDGTKKTQKLLLTWICEDTKVYKLIKPYVEINDFSEDIYKKAAELLFAQIEQGELNEARIIGCFTNEEEQTEVASLFNTEKEKIEDGDKGKVLHQLLYRLKEESFNRRAGQSSLNPEEMTAYFDAKKKLEELKKITFNF